MQDDAGGSAGGKEGEGADMPHPPYQARADPGAEHEAGKVGRAEETQYLIGESFGITPQGYQCVEKSRAHQQQRNARQQGTDGGNNPQHARPLKQQVVPEQAISGSPISPFPDTNPYTGQPPFQRSVFMSARQLLLVAHAPSDNTARLRDAVLRGASASTIENVKVRWVAPLEATPDDVLQADAIILGTTENLGYMSGALKDFFDRCYYPVLERKQGMPCALYIRAGHDGTGTRRAIESIVTGLRWSWAQDPLVLRGDWQPGFLDQAEELGLYMAAGLDSGIF